MYKLHRPVARRALILSRYIIQLRRIVLSFTYVFSLALTHPSYTHTHSIVTLQQIYLPVLMSAELLFTNRDRKSRIQRSPRSSLILANLYDEILRGHGARTRQTVYETSRFMITPITCE